MTPTEQKLMSVHKSPALRLVDICDHYLGLGPAYAKRMAGEHALPFPAFRLAGSQKSPWMVKVEDLAGFLDAQAATAQSDWMNSQV